MASRNGSSLLPLCKCGMRSTLKTSWTDKNPSRRFATCGGEEGDGWRCSFFEWVDPEMCRRSVEVIPGLLRKIRVMQEDFDAQKTSLLKVEEKFAKLQRRFTALKIENGEFRVRLFGIGVLAMVSWVLCIFLVSRLIHCHDNGIVMKMLPLGRI